VPTRHALVQHEDVLLLADRFERLGHTVTLTSPRCAFFSSSIVVRDWPMPPPIESGIRSFRMAW